MSHFLSHFNENGPTDICKAISAERARFELAIPFWGTHAFQACLFSHSSISPIIPYSRVAEFGTANIEKLFGYLPFVKLFSKIILQDKEKGDTAFADPLRSCNLTDSAKAYSVSDSRHICLFSEVRSVS